MEIVELEEWKPILNHENYYAISILGQVKNINTNRILIGDVNSEGYKRITLYNPFKKRYFIHRLVAMHFVNGYQKDLIVNHIDGNKQNNNFHNLEWVTHSMNDIHAFKNNLRRTNNKKKVARYNLFTNEILEVYDSINVAAILNDTTTVGISNTCNKKYRQWLGYGYKFI